MDEIETEEGKRNEGSKEPLISSSIFDPNITSNQTREKTLVLSPPFTHRNRVGEREHSTFNFPFFMHMIKMLKILTHPLTPAISNPRI
ncbi:hypothetical protein VNO80_23659 [Phaseolus coccineus]|uniref:Uncharacterized protein n=1 Tax=Phaseolus coccineus TaxID=3886 RepID=A0AAN9M6R1_PHACN